MYQWLVPSTSATQNENDEAQSSDDTHKCKYQYRSRQSIIFQSGPSKSIFLQTAQLWTVSWNWKHPPGRQRNCVKPFHPLSRRKCVSRRPPCASTYRRARSTTTFSANRIEWTCWKSLVSMRMMKIRCSNSAVISRCRRTIGERENLWAPFSILWWIWKTVIVSFSMKAASLDSVGGGPSARNTPLLRCITMVMRTWSMQTRIFRDMIEL